MAQDVALRCADGATNASLRLTVTLTSMTFMRTDATDDHGDGADHEEHEKNAVMMHATTPYSFISCRCRSRLPF